MANKEIEALTEIPRKKVSTDGTYIVPKHIKKICTSIMICHPPIGVRKIIIRDNVEYIESLAFEDDMHVLEKIYCPEYLFNKFKYAFASMPYNSMVITIDDETETLLRYKEIPFQEECIYKSKAIYVPNIMDAYKRNKIYGEFFEKKVFEFTDKKITFLDNYIGTFSAKTYGPDIYFKVKIDKEGYPFAEEVITKEILPIIGYKNDKLFISPCIEEVEMALAYSCIQLAKREEIEKLTKKRGRTKRVYEGYIKELTNSFNLIRMPEFDYVKALPQEINKDTKTNLIEEIRNQLFNILDINIAEYQKYNKLFQEILNSGLDNQTIQGKLINLSAELEVKLLFKEISLSENSTLIENIEALSSKYFDRLVKNEGTTEDKTFDTTKIDMIAKLFISIKDSINYFELDNISKNIAFMYLSEIKLYLENTNDKNINIENNIYIKHFTSYILFIIKILIINGYIKTDIKINLQSLNVIELIDSLDISNIKQNNKKKILSFDKIDSKKEE